jgi:hypothetical protein
VICPVYMVRLRLSTAFLMPVGVENSFCSPWMYTHEPSRICWASVSGTCAQDRRSPRGMGSAAARKEGRVCRTDDGVENPGVTARLLP